LAHAGKLTDLSHRQRERVLGYLLAKLRVLTRDEEILGVVRPDSQQAGIKLPPLPPPRPQAPDEAAPTAAVVAAGTILGRSTIWSGLEPMPAVSRSTLLVSAGVQTTDPGLHDADALLAKVLSDVRPWGSKRAARPFATARKGALPGVKRAALASRSSLATSQSLHSRSHSEGERGTPLSGRPRERTMSSSKEGGSFAPGRLPRCLRALGGQIAA
jgi:hypothetical protein